MIFTRLKLNNFKSHKNTTINFNKGISVIVGENGAGKSTILEAISFALFKQHTAKKIDDLVRNNGNAMSVELQFITNGKEYKIVREKKSNLKSSLYAKTSLDSGFMHICSGDREVNNEIKQILDIDSDLFLNAIYIRQGEIAELVDKTPADKKQLIAKLLGIDSLEKAWKNLLPFINNYELKLSELEGKLYNSQELKDDYERKSRELEELKVKGHELEGQIEEVTKSLTEISASKRDMETEKEIYEKLVHNLETEELNLTKLEENKRNVQENLDKIREAEEQISRLEKYVSKLDVYLEFEKSVVAIQNLKEEENQIEQKLESIGQQKAIVKDKKEEYDKFLASEEQMGQLDAQKVSYEKDLAAMAQLEQEKKDLLSAIETERNEIEKFFSKSKNQLDEYGLDQDALDEIDDFTHLQEACDTFSEETSKRVKELSEEIISKNEEIVVFKQSIKSCQKPLAELDGVDNKCPICQSDLSEKQKDKLIKDYESTIEECEKSISQYQIDVEASTKDKQTMEENLANINELSKEIIDYKHKVNHLENQLVKLKKIDEGLESKELISNKLGELILVIAKERTARESYKASYDAYNKANGALEVLGDETEVQFKLKQVKNEIDNHVKLIKDLIEQDPHLSADISASELKNRIADLKQKNEEYNQFIGFVKNKNSLMSQHDAIKDEIGTSLNQKDIIKNKIEATVYDQEKYEQILFRYEMYERKQNTLNNDLALIKGQARESIAYRSELAQKIKVADQFRKEHSSVSDYVNVLKHIRELFDKNAIQKDLRGISKPLIQKYTKEFFNEFNFNYSDLTLDDEYDVTVYGPEGESSLTMVSGGEKIAIALALRLGITKAMSKGDLDTILLDEPTIHLDASRRHELINLLKDMSVLPQMIIVTHESQLENAADNLIKVEKENGISNVIV